jgi:hypothetical protein
MNPYEVWGWNGNTNNMEEIDGHFFFETSCKPFPPKNHRFSFSNTFSET